MVKYIKWTVLSIVSLISLVVIAIIVESAIAPRDVQGNDIWLQKLKLKSEPEITVSYIRSLKSSVELFKNDNARLPSSLNELSRYNPQIEKMERFSLDYKTIPNADSYTICAPYFQKKERSTSITKTTNYTPRGREERLETWVFTENKACYSNTKSEGEKIGVEPETIKPAKIEISRINSSSTAITGHQRGSKSGSVTIVSQCDFTTPLCKTLAEKINKLLEKYPDEISLIYKHFPGTGRNSYDSRGSLSASYAEAAGLQGKFWEMYDTLYENQEEWMGVSSGGANQKALTNGKTAEKLLEYSQNLGLDLSKVLKDVDPSGEAYAKLISDYKETEVWEKIKSGVSPAENFFTVLIYSNQSNAQNIVKEINDEISILNKK